MESSSVHLKGIFLEPNKSIHLLKENHHVFFTQLLKSHLKILPLTDSEFGKLIIEINRNKKIDDEEAEAEEIILQLFIRE